MVRGGGIYKPSTHLQTHARLDRPQLGDGVRVLRLSQCVRVGLGKRLKWREREREICARACVFEGRLIEQHGGLGKQTSSICVSNLEEVGVLRGVVPEESLVQSPLSV